MPGIWELIKAEATTNLVTNPSFENDTTGWAAAGTNTIARDTTTAKFGVVSLKCTYQNNTDLAQYTATSATFPTQSTTYLISGWVYVPSSWDGGNIRLEVSNLTGATPTYNWIYTDGTSSNDAWVYMETSLALGTDQAGEVNVATTSAPTASEFVYVDGIQIEEKTYVTTYCDGDQDGCSWTAGEHASTSTRAANAYQGGRVRDLADDFSVFVNSAVGIGVPAIDTNISEMGLSSGGFHQTSRYRTRNWQLICQIDGTSLANLHSTKRAFVKALDPRRLGEVDGRGTPVRFRYTGADVDTYIDAYYAGGAEGVSRQGFTEIFPLRLVSPYPFFTAIGDVATVLDSEDTATITLVAKRNGTTGQWDNMSLPTYTALTNGVQALAQEADGTIWLAGDFTNLEGNAAWDYVATYDPVADSFASPVTTACDNACRAVTVAADGIVYLGGDFANIDGVSAANIAQMSTSGTWTALGSGTSSTVRVIKQGPDGLIYVGGNFTTAGGVTVRGIATWDGSTWAAVGPPSSGGDVFDLGWDRSGNLYVVGSFTNWDGTAESDYLAKWDGSTWAAVTSDVFDGAIYAITFDNSGNFYVGGNFDNYNSVAYNNIAYYNGTTFEKLSTGVNNTVWDLAIDYQSKLWVSGFFTTAGSNTLSARIALWNGTSFEHSDISFGGTPVAYALLATSKDMYIGGDFDDSATYAGSATATNNGSTLAYPVLYISRSGGTASTLDSIRNHTTGAELLFNYQFVDGEILRIDLRPGRRKMVSSVFGEGWKLLSTSDVSGFTFAPGANTITSFFRTTGSPTMTVWAIWQETHLGVD